MNIRNFAVFKKFCTLSSNDSIFTKKIGKNLNILGLYMNTPKNRNALSKSLLDSMKMNISKINSDNNLRAVILMSKEPGYFCSGADLKERQTMNEEQTEIFVTDLRGTFHQLSQLNIPLICGIDGFALGGGLELALNADIRICTKSSTLGLTECSLGVIPGAGGTQNLPRLIGISKAKELIFTAERINAEEALKLGIVNHTVDSYEELESKSLEIAEKIAKNAPLSVKNSKRAINEGYGHELGYGLLIESKFYRNILSSQDRIEGLKAFLEKRKPTYIGK